ncbi:MAG TPA: imidazole glycerol phosphate synthase subunit HisH [Clostridia bacterium]|nr:imidazole glycerol phosphate synthase subunit HisH [Clostridia bacterium]
MIAIIDYEVGNLGSVKNALRYIGQEAVITSDPAEIRRANAVVFPGVGAFSNAMSCLERSGLTQIVEETVREDKLFLGICLGMQMLFDYSEEGGERVDGLGLFGGSIRLLPQNMGLKVPHMGWNSLHVNDSPLFKGLPENPYVYFVHSYYLDAADKSIVTAACDYGVRFDAAIGSGRLFATQFHPEKSGEVGLAILKNWVSMI